MSKFKILGLIAIIGLSAIAFTTYKYGYPFEIFNSVEQTFDPITDEETVRERLHSRWEALIDLDIDKVYGYATPAYRDAHNLTHLNNQYAAQIIRLRIEITDFAWEENAEYPTAKIWTRLHFKANGFEPGQMLDLVSNQQETWVKQRGTWWFVEPK